MKARIAYSFSRGLARPSVSLYNRGMTTSTMTHPMTQPHYGYISGGTHLLNPRAILEEMGLADGQIVADLGAGSGAFFTIQAAMIVGEKGRVYSVDILRSVLSAIEGKSRIAGLTNVKTVWSNLEMPGATRIPDHSADVAFLVNVLFQTKKPENVMGEAMRLVKSGGKILVIDWRPGETRVGPSAERRISQDEIRAIAMGLGLKEARTVDAGDYHYGLIFVKE